MIKCKICGKEFEPRSTQQQCCSKDCSLRSQRNAQAAWQRRKMKDPEAKAKFYKYCAERQKKLWRTDAEFRRKKQRIIGNMFESEKKLILSGTNNKRNRGVITLCNAAANLSDKKNIIKKLRKKNLMR